MIGERRSQERVKVHEICYIQIDEDNGGVVLDVCEEGLRFQAAGPVQRGKQVRFSFSLPERGRVGIVGEIAWTSADKKVGGVRFTNLTPAGRGCIRELLAALPTTHPEEQPSPVATGLNPAGGNAGDNPAARAAVAQTLPSGLSSDLPADARPSFQLGSSFAPAQSAALSGQPLLGVSGPGRPARPLMEEWNAARRQGFFRGLLVGIAVTAIAAAAGLWTLRNYQREIIGSPTQAEATLPSEQTAPPADAGVQPTVSQSLSSAPPASAPPDDSPGVDSQTATSNAPTTAAPTTAAPQEAAPTAKTADPEGSYRAADPKVEAAQSGEAGQTELNMADQYLRSKRDAPDAEQWLWAAVEKGNTQAEVELSDLYLTGDGIKRNCEQALILLRAAAEKGSLLARQKLETVNRTGCRS